MGDDRRQDALRLLAAEFKPFTLTFDVMDGVASPPLAIIAERALSERQSNQPPL
ncbi:hypothetical protein [Sphingobium sp.]|uniref:hypothetical protein n=1 Tax=Sphingobium sp. TaxID=1912891 RepID=UPI00257E8CAE|nr:hypothetical protein [Sphingobium sp.]